MLNHYIKKVAQKISEIFFKLLFNDASLRFLKKICLEFLIKQQTAKVLRCKEVFTSDALELINKQLHNKHT